MKPCIICGEIKPLTEFYKNSRLLDGHENRCKKCKIKAGVEWKRRNKDKVAKASRRRYLKYGEDIKAKCRIYGSLVRALPSYKLKARIKTSNRRALIRGLPGFYTTEDIDNIYIEQLGKCPYCGKRLSNYFEIDHIHPASLEGSSNFAYNLQLTCLECNRSKSNKTHEEFLDYLRLKEQYNGME